MAGPFYLHWVDATDKVWDEYGAFAINDEDVVAFEVTHEEGDFAALSIDVRNPKIGLLAPLRQQWVWLSWDRAWMPLPPQQVDDPAPIDAHTPDIVPLFFGRLVGVPTTINREIVTLEFTARPADYQAQKAALAETLKVAPYYDPVFINPANIDDPDTVLEARSALWHIDRITHDLTTSDILAGEDGVKAYTGDEVPYDTVEISISQTPLRSITVDAKLNWAQADTGTIDFGTRSFETYTGSSLIKDWPKAGVKLQAGWSVESSSINDRWRVEKAFTANFNQSWSSVAAKHEVGDTLSTSLASSTPILEGTGTPYLKTVLSGETHTGVAEAHSNSQSMYVLKYLLDTALVLRYEANRPRVERVKFTLKSNVQSLVTDPGEDEVSVIDISSVDVSLPLPDETVPIESVALAQYLPTTRGRQSLEYLVSLARANLLQRARAVNISWKCLFERAIEMTCRMNASIADDRLPGGAALGKVSAYSFKCDGNSGELSGTVTIGCAIGYGGSVAAVDGDPTYCDDDYVEHDYQTHENEIAVLTGGDVGYTVPIEGPTDDGLHFPLTKDQVVVHEEWHGTVADQEAAILGAFPTEIALANNPTPFTVAEQEALQTLSQGTVAEIMKEHAIWYDLQLKPVNSGAFTTEYNIIVTDLEVPQMIDLEAT